LDTFFTVASGEIDQRFFGLTSTSSSVVYAIGAIKRNVV
jgi:hypothetical protein